MSYISIEPEDFKDILKIIDKNKMLEELKNQLGRSISVEVQPSEFFRNDNIPLESVFLNREGQGYNNNNEMLEDVFRKYVKNWEYNRPLRNTYGSIVYEKDILGVDYDNFENFSEEITESLYDEIPDFSSFINIFDGIIIDPDDNKFKILTPNEPKDFVSMFFDDVKINYELNLEQLLDEIMKHFEWYQENGEYNLDLYGVTYEDIDDMSGVLEENLIYQSIIENDPFLTFNQNPYGIDIDIEKVVKSISFDFKLDPKVFQIEKIVERYTK